MEIQVFLHETTIFADEFYAHICSTGRTFYFEINNYPVFVKGSNWVPGFLFPDPKNHTDRYEYFLNSAKVSNINTLRVWGGGVSKDKERKLMNAWWCFCHWSDDRIWLILWRGGPSWHYDMARFHVRLFALSNWRYVSVQRRRRNHLQRKDLTAIAWLYNS